MPGLQPILPRVSTGLVAAGRVCHTAQPGASPRQYPLLNVVTAG